MVEKAGWQWVIFFGLGRWLDSWRDIEEKAIFEEYLGEHRYKGQCSYKPRKQLMEYGSRTRAFLLEGHSKQCQAQTSGESRWQ